MRRSAYDESDDSSPRPSPSPRDMPRKQRRVNGAPAGAEDTAAVEGTTAFGVSPTAILSNIQSAYSAFQSVQAITGLTSASSTSTSAAPGASGTTTLELGPLPDSLVTSILNPKNLNVPSSQGVLQARLSTNLPRHGNAYLILLVGTLLATHWLVLASLFAVVKFGLFIQSYNGRDLARELGLRRYTSTQGLMSGFAAAAALVALWAFSSVFSVVGTLVKVAMLVLLHAAFLDIDVDGGEAAQQQFQPQTLQQQPSPPRGKKKKSSPKRQSSSSSSTSLSLAAAQSYLRPAGTSLSPRDAAGQQLPPRSASEGQLGTTYANGWYAGEGEDYAAMPPPPQRSSRAFEGYYESGGRPQSYASGSSRY